MKAVKWPLIVALAAILCVCIAVNIRLQFEYTNNMPHSPQPATGRIYPVDVSHDVHRFVTEQELTRARVTQLGLYPLAVLCLLGIGVVKVRVK